MWGPIIPELRDALPGISSTGTLEIFGQRPLLTEFVTEV